jgi:transcriptional regulator with XRE-family HTH domain
MGVRSKQTISLAQSVMQNNRTNISRFLKQQRDVNSWSQRELAKRLGATQANVQMWEAEKTAPDLASMEKIAVLFSLSLSELFKILESGKVAKQRKCGITEIMDAINDLPTSDVAKISIAATNRLVQAS